VVSAALEVPVEVLEVPPACDAQLVEVDGETAVELLEQLDRGAVRGDVPSVVDLAGGIDERLEAVVGRDLGRVDHLADGGSLSRRWGAGS
jgi:hypothetical protein